MMDKFLKIRMPPAAPLKSPRTVRGKASGSGALISSIAFLFFHLKGNIYSALYSLSTSTLSSGSV